MRNRGEKYDGSASALCELLQLINDGEEHAVADLEKSWSGRRGTLYMAVYRGEGMRLIETRRAAERIGRGSPAKYVRITVGGVGYLTYLLYRFRDS